MKFPCPSTFEVWFQIYGHLEASDSLLDFGWKLWQQKQGRGRWTLLSNENQKPECFSTSAQNFNKIQHFISLGWHRSCRKKNNGIGNVFLQDLIYTIPDAWAFLKQLQYFPTGLLAVCRTSLPTAVSTELEHLPLSSGKGESWDMGSCFTNAL